MGGILANVSWLTVIVSTVLCMGLGAVWYNPKFPTGKIWANGAGVSGEAPDEFPALAMGLNTLCYWLRFSFHLSRSQRRSSRFWLMGCSTHRAVYSPVKPRPSALCTSAIG